MKNLDEKLLQEMTGRLVAEFDPEQVILFGSHAWGVPGEDSDIDLFIVVPESSERPLARARRALACLEGLRVPKDVLVRTRQETEKYR
ncbi:MAG: nucleotidyltransferase domain-containing protein, partial [Desulfuromonadales bacterium]|nr:nucleotidyltransferase domain-containing protein [Desulfuromonadales bacterium]